MKDITFITETIKLVRKELIDLILDYINKEQVIDIFTTFTDRADKAQEFYEQLSRFNINVSTSLLQQYLLKYINETNIDKIIDNLDELKKIWKDISPDSYFQDKAKKSTYYIQLIKNDIVIPYEQGSGLVHIFDNKQIKYEFSGQFTLHQGPRMDLIRR